MEEGERVRSREPRPPATHIPEERGFSRLQTKLAVVCRRR